MKYLFLTFTFFFSSILIAQDLQVLNKIDELNVKIKLSKKGEKLQLMDSLGTTLNYNPSLNYDSIVKKTIQFALLLDSLSIAVNNTANLIYFNNSILGKPKKGLVIFNQFLAKNLTIKNNYALARFYLNGADSYFFINEHTKALENYKIAEAFALKAKNERLLGFVNLYSGHTNESLGDFSKASQNYNKAYNYFLKVKDTFNVLSSKNSLSILYSKNGLFEEAQIERNESISLLKITKNYGQLATVYYNAALDYNILGVQNKRISNLLNALEVNEKSKNSKFARPTILNRLTIAYAQNNDILLAEKYLKEFESNSEVFSKEKNNNNYQEAIMNIEFAKGNFKKALAICKNLLNSKIGKGNPLGIERFEKFLSLIYEKTGDPENALIHLKNYLVLNDSIKSVQKTAKLIYYQTLYETKKRDLKIDEQEKNISLLNAENKVKTQWFIFTSTGLLSFFVFMLLMRSRNTASKRQKLQEKFSENLITAQENERISVARELHDSVGQKLMLLTKKTKSHGTEEMADLAVSTLEELRSLSKGLYPSIIDGLGVTNAIKSMINEVDKHTTIFFTEDLENIDNHINKDQALHLYRIIQELLTNIVKHAEATTVFVTIEKTDNLITIIVKDNGKGFDFFKAKLENKSLGMKTILERSKIINSKLTIHSSIGKGTTVKLVIPIK